MPASSQDPASISVTGYSPRFVAAFRKLLKTEGGLVSDPADRGGITKYGISLRFLASEGAFDADQDGRADFDLDMDGDIDADDIRKLSISDAEVLYYRCFWVPTGAEGLPAPLGEVVFDQAVNGGISAAVKLLQRAVNICLARASKVASTGVAPLIIDGVKGQATAYGVLWILRNPGLGMPALIAAFREAAKKRYRAIALRYPAQRRFLGGWLNRAEQLGREGVRA